MGRGSSSSPSLSISTPQIVSFSSFSETMFLFCKLWPDWVTTCSSALVLRRTVSHPFHTHLICLHHSYLLHVFSPYLGHGSTFATLLLLHAWLSTSFLIQIYWWLDPACLGLSFFASDNLTTSCPWLRVLPLWLFGPTSSCHLPWSSMITLFLLSTKLSIKLFLTLWNCCAAIGFTTMSRC